MKALGAQNKLRCNAWLEALRSVHAGSGASFRFALLRGPCSVWTVSQGCLWTSAVLGMNGRIGPGAIRACVASAVIYAESHGHDLPNKLRRPR